ncbi:prolyl oligopeptidase [Corynebacterium frankenforstense DSM 45800]|uniref:Prolyl oligopeptidase n=1 Tax=Corynebacterium frankenforstense DSM 45800 TaxID=1437875 RepID=A0A1L7CQN4_9CORY|nr:prolyl oligopeptidase family serine peptidase [Corynebacterium frankenforstense]APT88154.1 prolyl oligopeptidase [Corynebacterium frankenforstense DSM 45800]
MTTRAEIDPTVLESIEDPTALAWASDWSAQTESAAAAAPGHDALEARIRAALDADDRIPYVNRRGERLFNFWRDAQHPRGLWRCCDEASYLAGSPDWRVLVDVDALAAAEDESWVWKGAQVLRPDCDRALVRLSRGGADAVVLREFDLSAGAFVTDSPFEVPAAKTSVSWVDRDRLLIGTDLGEDSLTESGYPLQTRLWRRGTPLADAPVVAVGERRDVAAGAWADTAREPRRLLFSRALDFYRSREWVAPLDALDAFEAEGAEIPWRPVEVPEDCETVIRGRWLFVWPRTGFAGVPAGGLGRCALEDFLAGSREFTPVYTPDGHASLQSVVSTRNHLVLTELRDVVTRVLVTPLEPDSTSGPAAGDGTGEAAPLTELEIPGMVTAAVIAASEWDGDELWINTSSFTRPATLYRVADAGDPRLEEVRRAPERFDATGVETRQHWARSADGTEIPYFVVGRFGGATENGSAHDAGGDATTGGPGSAPRPAPTLVGGYGGFEVSLVPGYSAVRGMAWLERGFTYVQPNLRGGGEFGPEWHTQATKLNRRRVFEDHRAVLEDLVARGYTTPDKLAVRGGSNGGLLTSGALTQYPQDLGAAVIQVPLTDMLRYHTLSAGASWMAEYGDPEVPEEREVIASYSPLHNVAAHSERAYPPALVTTSTRDDRVHPAHARLFARALAEAGQPVDYFENTEGGHAGAADNGQVARVEALIYCWLYTALGL